MANPQKENGYTAIANDIMMALSMTYIPSGPMRIILQVLRLTWGYNRKWVQISHSELAKRTTMPRQHATRYMDRLFAHNVLRSAHAQVANDDIRVVTKDKRVKPVGFVKDYESWTPFVRQIGTRSGGKSSEKIGTCSGGKREEIGTCSGGKQIGTRSGGKLSENGTRSGGKRENEIGTRSGANFATCSGADLKNPPIIFKEKRKVTGSGDPVHFSKSIPVDTLEKIVATAKRVSVLPISRRTKFNPWQWIQFQANKKMHPNAILDCLESVECYAGGINGTVWQYLNNAIRSRSQNYNEADHVRQADDFKKQLKNAGGDIGRLLKLATTVSKAM